MCTQKKTYFQIKFFKKNWCKKHKIKQWLQLLLTPISIATPFDSKQQIGENGMLPF